MFSKKQKFKKSNLISKSFYGALAFLLCFGFLVQADDNYIQGNDLIENKDEIINENEDGNYKKPLNPPLKKGEDKSKKNKQVGEKKIKEETVENKEEVIIEENKKEKRSEKENLKENNQNSEEKGKNEIGENEDFKKNKKKGKKEIIQNKIQEINGTEKDNNRDRVEDQEDEGKNKNQNNKQEDKEEVNNLRVIINEIAWMGTTESSYDEWIELKNLENEDIDIDGWVLLIGLKEIKLGGNIKKGGFYLLERTNDDSVPEIKADLIYTGSLNNGGEDLILKDDLDKEVDAVREKDKDAWSAGDNDQKFTMERIGDGKWQDSFVVNGTPKEENSLKINEDENEDGNQFSKPKTYSGKVEMTELMPNPEGNDKNQEWLELFSRDEENIELEGWYFLNQSDKKFKLDGLKIKSGDKLKVEIKASSFSLKNSAGWIELRNPNDEIVDRVEYLESAKTNSSYNKKSKNKWEWSIFSTPGKKNKFNHVPTFKVKIPDEIYKDMKTEFEISNAKDRDGEDLKYRWEFSTSKRSYIPITTQTFDKKGKYTVEVRVGDRSIDVFKSFKFKVENFPEFDLEIVKLLPNPAGSDSDNEKIWIKNNEDKRINLKGWIIATGKNSENLTNHYIKDDFKIKAGDIEAIERNECAFSLLNKKARIVLKSPNGEIIDKVKYEKEKIGEGEIYLNQNEEWAWILPEKPSDNKEKTKVLGLKKIELVKPNFYEIRNKILLNENQKRSSSFQLVCFNNWLYSKSEKPFSKLFFPESFVERFEG